MPGRVLIVDDDDGVRAVLREFVEEEGYEAVLAANGPSALAVIAEDPPDVVLLDIRMPDMDGIEVLRRAKEISPILPVVMISGTGGVEHAVTAMKLGAEDFITKPCRQADVFRAVHRAMRDHALMQKVRRLMERAPDRDSLAELMGPSEAISRLSEEISRVAPSTLSVVVSGETGTGKELVARAIHGASSRSAAEFVPVDCGAIPESLFEAEIFGHERGAFTGAERQKAGRFELASGGTLFLDEVSNMPLACQAKLLRAIQERSIVRVGGTMPIRTDTRILAASNRDLAAEVESGRFRPDLFYRLSEYAISVPPLRQRREDVLHLARRFLDLAKYEMEKPIQGFSEDAVERLLSYSWPGNVRELRSTIRRAALLARGRIEARHLGRLEADRASPAPAGAALRPLSPKGGADLPLKEQVRSAVEAVERAAITRALRRAGGNKAEAARRLGIDYTTLYAKLKKLSITTASVLEVAEGAAGERHGIW